MGVTFKLLYCNVRWDWIMSGIFTLRIQPSTPQWAAQTDMPAYKRNHPKIYDINLKIHSWFSAIRNALLCLSTELFFVAHICYFIKYTLELKLSRSPFSVRLSSIMNMITSITDADINPSQLRMILDPVKHFPDFFIFFHVTFNAKELAFVFWDASKVYKQISPV